MTDILLKPQTSVRAGNHDLDRPDLEFAEGDQRDYKVYHDPYVDVTRRKSIRPACKYGRQENIQTSDKNQGYDSRAKKSENSLHECQVPVLVIKIGQDGNKDTGGKNDAECREHRAGNSADQIADKACGGQ